MALDPQDMTLAGRVALVTGAAVGLGEAIATSFARFGADLSICDRDGEGLAATAREVRAAGRRVFQARLDVRDGEAVARFVAGTLAELGRIDVLVNNAGGGFEAPFLEVRPNGQRALVDENFTSVTHFVREVAPHLPDGSGAIVNLTSIEAHRAAPGYAIYAAMKSAVASLTKSLALELGARGIRVNCIAPDVIPTPGIGDAPANTPLARAGHPDDVAGAALFLASPLSRFVTGTTVHVDGGNRAAGGWRRLAGGRFGV
jgi:NAD(P)-dependent dehydrogenase (short-subunit alcohol dehydrogenase family)